MPLTRQKWDVNACGIRSKDEDVFFDIITKHALTIEKYVRRYFKINIIRALDRAGVHVEIIGKNWNPDLPFSGNVTVHEDFVSREECLKRIQRAKLALNLTPWSKNGCSERVFDIMLNGAVCLSESNHYLHERFQDGKELVFLDLLNLPQMAEDARWLLEHPQAAAKIAGEGQLAASMKDTWKERVQCLVSLFDDEA